MKTRTAVILLVAVALVAVLLLFYGAVRPPGRGSDDRVEGALGWLRSQRELTFDDVAHAECADGANRVLVVGPGESCSTPLPVRSTFGVCTSAEPGSAALQVGGRDYPDQHWDGEELACTTPLEVDVYDEDSVLVLGCAALAPAACEFRVG